MLSKRFLCDIMSAEGCYYGNKKNKKSLAKNGCSYVFIDFNLRGGCRM